jgi:Uma2 family endonuclease
MTADELLCLPDDGLRHELVRGELRTMPPGGFDHSVRAGVLHVSLGSYVRARQLGEVLSADPGFRLTSDPDTVRAPDVAFIRQDRLPTGPMPGYYPGAPDLAVEVISPNDLYNDLYTEVDEKVAE